MPLDEEECEINPIEQITQHSPLGLRKSRKLKIIPQRTQNAEYVIERRYSNNIFRSRFRYYLISEQSAQDTYEADLTLYSDPKRNK